MNTYSNYPRNQFTVNIGEIRSLVSKLNKMAVVQLGLIIFFFVTERLVSYEGDLEKTPPLSVVLLLLSFVALLLVLALQAIWGARMVRMVAEIRNDSLKIPPLWTGFLCWWPVIGSFVLAYVAEYAITSCNQPRQKSFKWNTVLSKSTLGSIVIYSASLDSSLEVAYFLPDIEKLFPFYGYLSTAVGVVAAICLYLGMRLSTKQLLSLAETMERENPAAV